MSQSEGSSNNSANQVWPVIFVFVIVGALLLFVFLKGRDPVGTTAGGTAAAGHGTTAADGDGEGKSQVTVEQFMEALSTFEPQVEIMNMDCPIDQTTLAAPNFANRRSINRFGGVATDLMSIALSPPEEEGGRPGFDKQDWEMLLVTNPNNGATYHALDLFNFTRPGSTYAIDPDDWDLAALSPALAARSTDEWTFDERILMRVLTQRAYGVDQIELGFSALQGAYAANFGTWYGRKVHIPSAAFYALAAAYLAGGIEEDPTLNATARGIAAMTMGECYRLLGRQADAEAAFTVVEESGMLDTEVDDIKSAIEVLNQIVALNDSGDYALYMASHADFEAPPTGWYLLEMLPAINGHLGQHRNEWAGMDDPQAIIDAMLELVP